MSQHNHTEESSNELDGIGGQTARVFAAAGLFVALADLGNGNEAQDLIGKDKSSFHKADVSDRAQMEALADQAVLGELRRRSPLGIVDKPTDQTYAALYLASDASRYMTRQVLSVNGGSGIK